MNSAHLHLLLNHVPVFGVAFGILLLVLARWRRSDELRRVGLALLVATAVAGLAAYLTGEPAEEAVERLADVSEAAMERHEDAARFATIGTALAGMVALAALALRTRAAGVARGLTTLTLLVAAGAFALMAWTANLGGQIRHPEIGSTAAGGPEGGYAAEAPGVRDEDD